MLHTFGIRRNAEVCLTTYVCGETYQSYLPILLYSISKSYPEYDVILFLHEKLDKKVYAQIQDLNMCSYVRIFDSVYSDYNITPLQSKSLRWVLWDESFECYSYLYVVDIDMLYVREPLALHIQHIQHMKTTGLPFDNIRRMVTVSHSLTEILYRLKNARLTSFLDYLLFKGQNEKLSGLHFIDVKRYFSVFNEEVRKTYLDEIMSGSIYKYIQYPNTEVILANFIRRLGFNLDLVAIQTNSYASLDFTNCMRAEFRPHHGIHLGIFRMPCIVGESDHLILRSDAYSYYVDKLKEEYLQDPIFVSTIKSSAPNIKEVFYRLFNYYGIEL